MISVLGKAEVPITSAKAALGESGIIKAAFGLRADFLGADFFAAFLGADFFAAFLTAFFAAFFAGFFAFFAMAILIFELVSVGVDCSYQSEYKGVGQIISKKISRIPNRNGDNGRGRGLILLCHRGPFAPLL
jgi:hypothetical protein